jgi:glycosyltransferase involved in cell wall biosynthesis
MRNLHFELTKGTDKKSPTRILHFAQRIKGGPASYLDELASSQIKLYGSNNVRFLVPRIDRPYVRTIPDECIVEFNESKRTPAALFSLYLKALKVIDDFKPNILHLHSSYAGAIVRIAYLFTRQRPFIIYCAHGWAFSQNTHVVLRFLYAGIERILMSVTDICINVSDHEASLAIIFSFPKDKCITIKNGIHDFGGETLRKERKTGDKINLLFVGRHDPQKGLDLLLGAMEYLAECNVHLHVLGAPVVTGPRVSQRADLRNVTFYGWIPRNHVADFIANCDAIVVPSRWEAFGLVVTEAMRAGRPAIVSNRGALPELIVDGETGYITDIDDLRNFVAILKSLDVVKLRYMGISARNRYLKLYTADRMNSELEYLYASLMSGTGADMAKRPAHNAHDRAA